MATRGHVQGRFPASLPRGTLLWSQGREGWFCPGLLASALAAGDVHYCSQEAAAANALPAGHRAAIILPVSPSPGQAARLRKGSVNIGTDLGPRLLAPQGFSRRATPRLSLHFSVPGPDPTGAPLAKQLAGVSWERWWRCPYSGVRSSGAHQCTVMSIFSTRSGLSFPICKMDVHNTKVRILSFHTLGAIS